MNVSGFSGPGESSPFTFSARYGKTATLKGNGTFRVEPLLLAGDFIVKRLPITDFEPYLPENLNVTIADGVLDTKMKLRLERKKGSLTGQFGGELGVRRFYCLDAEADDLP